ncbi:alpha/beta hydrolase [Leifsonia sp. fls2-241-R2A-40a]|uniref:alpha/beta hydrolase n=1 Tax=Leifsonia sp. fls2-241-R2A-40a TaxID=3040290 RepID=UPI00254C450E|nr:alpha/beta hydrolase [Leifsonia sp. fls2-241-R2A-40a]
MRARAALVSSLVGVGAVVAGAVAFARASPWPSALVIRRVFTKGARETVAEMQPFVPQETTADVGVDAGVDGLTFDVFRPEGADGPLPTVVWVHGGAWLSGSSRDVEPYLRILAAEGFTAIGLNYTLAPEAAYPTALRQVNAALAHIIANAGSLGVDPSRVVLAGDSAGAQLAAQLAALTTSADYAQLVGIPPALRPQQLRGIILNCGVYDLDALAGLTGLVGWGFKTAMWAYSGTKDWSDSPAGRTMSVLRHVTSRFPPTYISGGNGDGLTVTQSVPMAAALRAAGVDVTELFWPADHAPALPHEYQFHLAYPEARDAVTATVAFLRSHLG